MTDRLLGIYLRDHLAGATAGFELARRTARENAGSALGHFLEDVLVPEIAEDRQTLRQLMDRLGIKPSRAKILTAWGAEKAARLKFNGELRRYSHLSRLLELEVLALGVEGKLALWSSLERVLTTEDVKGVFDFPHLAERARSQRARLEEHRLAAAATALG